ESPARGCTIAQANPRGLHFPRTQMTPENHAPNAIRLFRRISHGKWRVWQASRSAAEHPGKRSPDHSANLRAHRHKEPRKQPPKAENQSSARKIPEGSHSEPSSNRLTDQSRQG